MSPTQAGSRARAHLLRMPNDLPTTLRDIGTRMMASWPDFAMDLARLPNAASLTVRDLATLMLLAPGEHVGRPAVEALVGADAADTVIGVLQGEGLVSEGPKGIGLTGAGRIFLDRLVEVRAQGAARVLQTLPQATQNQVVQAWEIVADAVTRAESLVKA